MKRLDRDRFSRFCVLGTGKRAAFQDFAVAQDSALSKKLKKAQERRIKPASMSSPI
jgi:hypothetical protein